MIETPQLAANAAPGRAKRPPAKQQHKNATDFTARGMASPPTSICAIEAPHHQSATSGAISIPRTVNVSRIRGSKLAKVTLQSSSLC